MRKFILLTIIFFWPVNFIIQNSGSLQGRILYPVLLLLLSYLSFKLNKKYFIYPLLLIPFIEPKLAIFPVLSCIFFGIFDRSLTKKTIIAFLVLSLFIFAFSWKEFRGQTVFDKDREAEQQIVEKSNIYPDIFLARIFQNKPKVYIDKVSYNFFSLIDPNNYFFGFHPREIVMDNQNLKKFPSLSIVFAAFGFYFIKKFKDKSFSLAILASGIISLSILKIFDKTDFILWVPLSLVIIHGLLIMLKQKKSLAIQLFLIFYFLFTIPQFIVLLLGYN